MDNQPLFRKRKVLYFILGLFLMIIGITLVLLWWKDVMIVFRGFSGVLIALAGLVILSLQRD